MRLLKLPGINLPTLIPRRPVGPDRAKDQLGPLGLFGLSTLFEGGPEDVKYRVTDGEGDEIAVSVVRS